MEIREDVVEPTAAREIPDGKVRVLAPRDSGEVTFVNQDGKRPMGHGDGFGNARGARRMKYRNGIVLGLQGITRRLIEPNRAPSPHWVQLTDEYYTKLVAQMTHPWCYSAACTLI